MIIIGEKLNSSIPKTLKAFQEREAAYVIALIKKQAECGADYLDINTAMLGEQELDTFLWVLELVKKHCDCGIMVDSPSPAVIAEAVKQVKSRKIIINSVTIRERFEELVPIALEYKTGIVGLPIDENGMPDCYEKKIENMEKLIAKLHAQGIANQDMYIDVLIEALAVKGEGGKEALDAISYLSRSYPEVRSICGMSNISFGLPERKNINRSFLCASLYAGLKSAIFDNTNLELRKLMYATSALLGEDEYCMDYITFMREQE